MNDTTSVRPMLRRIQVVSLVVGIAAVVACVLGAVWDADRFFPAFLFAYVYWAGITLGCLAVALLDYLTASKWTAVVRRPAEAAARTLPLIALLFVPLVVGLPYLYPWARPELVAADPLLEFKSLYLNVPFFVGRGVAFFLAWGGIVLLAGVWTRRLDWEAEPHTAGLLRRLGGLGLIVWGATLSFAFVDWLMSLEPAWVSAIYPLMIIASSLLAAMAALVFWIALLSRQPPFSAMLTPRVLNDLGAMLLALVMLWGYLAFSQYLVIWMGNLPDEVIWYARRLEGGWQWVVAAIVLFQFALPFVLLLPQGTKRSAAALAGVSGLVLVIHLVEVYWLVLPAFHAQVGLHWLDAAAPLAVGGLWLTFFLQQFKARSATPV